MSLRTPLLDVLGIACPVLGAPMANVAGGALAAAVSRAGGLGFVGGGYGDPEWLGAELDEAGDARIGVGFITWRLAERRAALSLALERAPAAVLLSFGDVSPFAAQVHDAGARLLVQVQSVAQARAALDAGADVVVAQGAEAGGHAGERATLPLVPAVVDAADGVPVVAAGGIADGRGIAAALMLGAAGVMLGSRLYATAESLAHPNAKRAALAADGDDTTRSDVFDRLRGYAWPPGYALRTLDNATTRAARAGTDVAAIDRSAFERAVAAGDVERAPVIVGEAADLIGDLPAAAELVSRLLADAAARLRAAPGFLGD